MTTYSQLVDQMIRETRRSDLALEIATYLTQTIRELHIDPQTNGVCLFGENLREDQRVVNRPNAHEWEIPNPTNFQALALARYDNVFDSRNRPLCPKEYTPSYAMNQEEHFFYRAGGSYHFAGAGGVGSTISLAWFEYPRRLVYVAKANRLAEYDDALGWIYAASAITDVAKKLAREATTNWMLLRWREVIEEGLRAKVYKRVGDDARARMCFSMYSSQRAGLVTSESMMLEGFR